MKNPDLLYELLPVVHRRRDAEQGSPLRELLRVVTEQVNRVEGDIDQLYENWFIETCDDWVVPYIGDLLGYEALPATGSSAGSGADDRNRNRILIPRRDVAHTIGARRRKGTHALLEQLALDVASWPALAVEFFQRLAWTQNLHTPMLREPRFHRVRKGDTIIAISAQHRVREADLYWLNPTITGIGPLLAGSRVLIGWREARGATIDVRQQARLDRIGTPFDASARTVEVRRVNSARTVGTPNIPSVGLFVWRLKSYSVAWQGTTAETNAPTPSVTPAYCVEAQGTHCFSFSVLGHDTPLFNRPRETSGRGQRALALPVPLRRREVDDHLHDHYGPNASFCIWAPDWPTKGKGMPVLSSSIKIADLKSWHYQAARDQVLVDPERGRIVFPVRQLPRRGVTVLYHYGFSADMGGGEYTRTLTHPTGATVYRVGSEGDYAAINDALAQWQVDKQALLAAQAELPADAPRAPLAAVIEITDSAAYTEKLAFDLAPFESLQLRAANRRRPTLRLLDYQTGQSDGISVRGGRSSRLTLDGLLISGRGLVVQGPDRDPPIPVARTAETESEDAATNANSPDDANNPDQPQSPADDGSDDAPTDESSGDLCDITIRHCTLVPGWGVDCHCNPAHPTEPSIEVLESTAKLRITHSILGGIRVTANEVATDPVEVCLTDSLWDATSDEGFALSGPDETMAFVHLTVARCTVFGQVKAHVIELAEHTIFTGELCTARRQLGCVRFCHVPTGSRTPRRYHCQPDLVRAAVGERFAAGELTLAERDVALAAETARVRPVFNSVRYGRPDYGQLAEACAVEISAGANDESEMGAFHDLYQPQRAANLRARLEEYTPAGMNAGIINAT